MKESSVLVQLGFAVFPPLIDPKSSSSRTQLQHWLLWEYWCKRTDHHHIPVTLPTAPLLTLSCNKDRSPVRTSASCVMDLDGCYDPGLWGDPWTRPLSSSDIIRFEESLETAACRAYKRLTWQRQCRREAEADFFHAQECHASMHIGLISMDRSVLGGLICWLYFMHVFLSEVLIL